MNEFFKRLFDTHFFFVGTLVIVLELLNLPLCLLMNSATLFLILIIFFFKTIFVLCHPISILLEKVVLIVSIQGFSLNRWMPKMIGKNCFFRNWYVYYKRRNWRNHLIKEDWLSQTYQQFYIDFLCSIIKPQSPFSFSVGFDVIDNVCTILFFNIVFALKSHCRYFSWLNTWLSEITDYLK